MNRLRLRLSQFTRNFWFIPANMTVAALIAAMLGIEVELVLAGPGPGGDEVRRHEPVAHRRGDLVEQRPGRGDVHRDTVLARPGMAEMAGCCEWQSSMSPASSPT